MTDKRFYLPGSVLGPQRDSKPPLQMWENAGEILLFRCFLVHKVNITTYTVYAIIKSTQCADNVQGSYREYIIYKKYTHDRGNVHKVQSGSANWRYKWFKGVLVRMVQVSNLWGWWHRKRSCSYVWWFWFVELCRACCWGEDRWGCDHGVSSS